MDGLLNRCICSSLSSLLYFLPGKYVGALLGLGRVPAAARRRRRRKGSEAPGGGGAGGCRRKRGDRERSCGARG